MRRSLLSFIPALALVLAGLFLTPPASGSQAQEQLPNLVPMAPVTLQIGLDDARQLPALRFDASIWNRGDYAFELLGRPENGLYGTSAVAEQCVAWLTTRTCTQRQDVGKLSYHEQHGHYHFENFARYELRLFRKNGRIDMRDRGLIVANAKVSFCLQDVRASDEATTEHGAPWPPYYGCAAGMGMQGISPGWIDIYGPGLAGQALTISEVPDGRYALVIYTDPGGRVFETNDNDNSAVTGVVLSNRGKSVEAFCHSEPGSLTCDQPAGSDF